MAECSLPKLSILSSPPGTQRHPLPHLGIHNLFLLLLHSPAPGWSHLLHVSQSSLSFHPCRSCSGLNTPFLTQMDDLASLIHSPQSSSLQSFPNSSKIMPLSSLELINLHLSSDDKPSPRCVRMLPASTHLGFSLSLE